MLVIKIEYSQIVTIYENHNREGFPLAFHIVLFLFHKYRMMRMPHSILAFQEKYKQATHKCYEHNLIPLYQFQPIRNQLVLIKSITLYDPRHLVKYFQALNPYILQNFNEGNLLQEQVHIYKNVLEILEVANFFIFILINLFLGNNPK